MARRRACHLLCFVAIALTTPTTEGGSNFTMNLPISPFLR